MVKSAWYGRRRRACSGAEATPISRLRFKALESGARLSEVLQLNQEALPGYVYNSAYAESGVGCDILNRQVLDEVAYCRI